ncbi:Claudin-4 [Willisornis vidua]|uniref:Claudin n=1 Tax=Willisornis vidua TaxID=1566151 RepID=A0ABQ9DDC8_9PASS|nr:Claudin-4 [Willisornis vidua]
MAMMSMHMGGLVMCLVGWLGSILTCALPMWKVTTVISSSLAAAQVCSQGLWMSCAYDNSGQMQCRGYDSLMEVTSDLLSARMMVVTSLFVAFAAFLIFLSSGDFTRCRDDNGSQNKFTLVSGALLFMAGILIIVPVSWTANNVASNFYNPIGSDALRREMGASLYIGWVSSFLLLFGGIILCRSGLQSQENSYPRNYRGTKTCGPVSYPMKDYL